MIRLRFIIHIFVVFILWCATSYTSAIAFRLLLILLLCLPLFSILQLIYVHSQIRLNLIKPQNEIERLESFVWEINFLNQSKIAAYKFFIVLKNSTTTKLEQKINQQHNEMFLPAQSHQSIKKKVFPLHCGKIKMFDFNVFLRDTFGFFNFKMSQKKLSQIINTEVLIIPKLNLQEISQQKQFPNIEDGKKRIKQLIDNFDEIDYLRAYVDGDTLKKIHWKVSARTGKWFVKNFENNERPSFSLLLDMLVNEDKKLPEAEKLNRRDLLLESALYIIYLFLEAKITIELISFQPKKFAQEANTLTHLNHFKIQLAMTTFYENISLPWQLKNTQLLKPNQSYILMSWSLNEALSNSLKQIKLQTEYVWFIWLQKAEDVSPAEIDREKQLTRSGIFISKIII